MTVICPIHVRITATNYGFGVWVVLAIALRYQHCVANRVLGAEISTSNCRFGRRVGIREDSIGLAQSLGTIYRCQAESSSWAALCKSPVLAPNVARFT